LPAEASVLVPLLTLVAFEPFVAFVLQQISPYWRDAIKEELAVRVHIRSRIIGAVVIWVTVLITWSYIV